MNQGKRIIRQTHDVAHLLHQVRDRLPRAMQTLARELDGLDGYPTSASGADKARGGTAELTSVEAAVHARLGHMTPESRRLGPSAKLDGISSSLDSVRAEMNRVLHILDSLIVVTDKPRCVGDTGEHHSHLWARPECENIAEADRGHGLCTGCRQRRASALRDIERSA
jgi:hypothetical protein